MFAGIYFCDFNVVAKIANKSLANINAFTVCIAYFSCDVVATHSSNVVVRLFSLIKN